MPTTDKMQPTVFFATRSGDIRGTPGLRRNTSGAVQALAKVVHDGDTIQVHLSGSGSLRFLGIDTAEISLNNTALNAPRLVAKFADPAVLDLPGLDPGLRAHLAARIGPDAAANQHRHAVLGQRALQAMVEADMTDLGQTADSFSLFIEFSFEVFDTNGRFLVFVNRNQPATGGARPLSYNERMLEAGKALPYFIRPNVAPFRDFDTVIDAVPAPGSLASLAAKGKLGLARDLVKAARARAQAGDGTVFDPADPQTLEAFELRFLDKRKPPYRGVIDLSRPSHRILRPQNYWTIPNPEDRLFIPAEFVPAFAARGWKLEGW